MLPVVSLPLSKVIVSPAFELELSVPSRTTKPSPTSGLESGDNNIVEFAFSNTPFVEVTAVPASVILTNASCPPTSDTLNAVSYTHLTLPTIYSV